MRSFSSVLVIVAMLLLAQPAVSGAQLVLYDDFSSGRLDPTRWFGSTVSGGLSNPTTEVVRKIKFGQLEMRLNQYGLTNSNSGTSAGENRLLLTNPAVVTTLQARVTVLEADAESCPTNTGATVRSRIQLLGAFFNDGNSTGAGDRRGDINATIHVLEDAALGRIIQAVITRCSDSQCTMFPNLSVQNLNTTWTVNRAVTIAVEWDAANHQFVFSATPRFGQTETITLPYSQTDTTPAGSNFKELRMFNSAANCVFSRKHAFMDILVDNVKVNP